MILYIPIRLFRVRYQVASGRPYSRFERLLLRALAAGCDSVDELSNIFQIHKRLLLEGIVTLAHAGWISINQDGRLRCTEPALLRDPSLAVASPELPSTLEIFPETAELVQERITGQLVRKNLVSYALIDLLKKQSLWQDELALPAGNVPPRLEPGQCRPYLRIQSVEQGGYIRSINSSIDLLRTNNDVLVVSVDLTRSQRSNEGAISGLPAAWLPSLSDIVLSYAQRQWTEQRRSGGLMPSEKWATRYQIEQDPTDAKEEEASRAWGVPAEAVDLVVGVRVHREVLWKQLRDPACGYLFLVTPALRLKGVQALWGQLEEALQRGLVVDILWGSEPTTFAELESHRQALDLLKKLVYDSARWSSAGRLRVGLRPSGVRSSIVLSAKRQGDSEIWQAIVGTYDWLGSSTDGKICSVQLTGHPPVARLCRILFDLAAADRQLSGGSALMRTARAAEELEKAAARPFARAPRSASSDGTRRVLLWMDRQHQAALRSFGESSALRIGTRRMQPNAVRNDGQVLARCFAGDAPQLRIECAESSDKSLVENPEHAALLRCVKLNPSLSMSYLAAPDRMLVTSHDWFAAYPQAVRPYAMDIGIEVEGVELPEDAA